VLSSVDDVVDWELIPGNDEDGYYAYIHFVGREPAVGLLKLLDKFRLVLELPLRFTSEGYLRVTVIGSDDNIQQALRSVPDTIDAQATQMGEYHPDDGRAIAGLTNRQREVLEAAVEKGYYEVPRQATYEDIAEVCDCTVGTVGEHLNRIESQIIHSAMD
jgi:predicted DNA binding protein